MVEKYDQCNRQEMIGSIWQFKI